MTEAQKKTKTKKEPTAKVKVEETAVTPYEAMDLADESQIVDELEGKLTAQEAETFVYSFTDKQTGRDIIGLSWKGTKATWWELNKRDLTDMTITDRVEIVAGDAHIDVAVYAFDKKRNIGAWGMARGFTKMQTSGGSMLDKFSSAKAMSKAQRNALNQLFPSELLAKIIQEWIKKGHVKKLSSKTAARTQAGVTKRSSRSYPTQEELMEKYGLDKSQVSPNCPSCGTGMVIMERKDGSGIFWSCKNWRTQGCKGLNIDEVEIDGTVTKK